MAPSATTTVILALRKTMLIIDPQEPVSSLFSRLALLEGWNLQQAPDNQTALSLMEAEGIDLVITGQRTPVRQDFELLGKIRCIDPHVRMIILKDRGTQEEQFLRQLHPELTCRPPRLGLNLHVAEITEAHKGRTSSAPLL